MQKMAKRAFAQQKARECSRPIALLFIHWKLPAEITSIHTFQRNHEKPVIRCIKVKCVEREVKLTEFDSEAFEDEDLLDFEEDDLQDVSRCITDPQLIVVASEGLDVSTHPGYCTNFNYYRVKNFCIVNSQNLPAKGKVDARFAETFAQFGVDVVVVGEISEEQAADFTSRGIAIARGAKGKAIDAAMDFLDGALDVTLP